MVDQQGAGVWGRAPGTQGSWCRVVGSSCRAWGVLVQGLRMVAGVRGRPTWGQACRVGRRRGRDARLADVAASMRGWPTWGQACGVVRLAHKVAGGHGVRKAER